MRILLLAHGFPPLERTGVENHVAALARLLASAGDDVLVVAPRRAPRLPHLAERSEERDGFRVHWIALNEPPRSAAEHLDPPGVARAIGHVLEREAPDVVHVHHLAKLGIGVTAEIERRGIASLYTAHDYFAVCHRIAMLRPDMARCDTVGDADLCARCDLAVSHLNAVAGPGDWQLGIFLDDLDEAAARELARRLAEPALDPDRGARAELDRQRREAFGRFDLVLAPSELVARRLIAGGLAPERVRAWPNAVEVEPLAAVARARRGPRTPAVFGFVGGVSKHKGLHVLLEAFRGLAGRARLVVHGDSSDRAYVERVRALAAAAGAEWRGAFDAAELPRVLAELDCLCVPSLWDENAPLAIREAFAAGIPVVASRVGALPESVRAGVDGLLVEPGDLAAWRAVLAELASDSKALAQLGAGVKAPPDLAVQVRELRELYARLAESAAERRAAGLPPSVRPFAARFSELAGENFDALAARVAGGIGRLRAELAPGTTGGLDARTLAPLASLRDLTRDREAERAWLRGEIAAQHGSRRNVQRALDSLERENRWLAETRTALERERGGLAEARDALAREAEWRRETAEHLARERDWLRSLADAQARERTALDEAHGALTGELAAARGELAALAAHERWLAGAAAELARTAGADIDSGDPAALERSLGQARERLARLRSELAWRAGEMRAAQEEGGALLRALVEKSALGRRMRGWAEGGGTP